LVDRKVTFPHLGSYFVPLEVLFKAGLGVDYIIPPSITTRTLELGSKHSPDTVCAPFKYNLGNYIESIEAGANTLIQVGGVCRLGYYGELHEQIIKDLGYDVLFINMLDIKLKKPLVLYNQLKTINPEMSLKKIAKVLPVVLKMIEYIDEAEDFIRKNVGFETTRGSFESTHQAFLEELRSVYNKKELNIMGQKHLRDLKAISVKKPKHPLRVGIVGEYYTIMVPYSNHYIEKELAKMGIVVDRWMSLSNSLILGPQSTRKERIKPYAKYDMGATCMF